MIEEFIETLDKNITNQKTIDNFIRATKNINNIDELDVSDDGSIVFYLYEDKFTFTCGIGDMFYFIILSGNYSIILNKKIAISDGFESLYDALALFNSNKDSLELYSKVLPLFNNYNHSISVSYDNLVEVSFIIDKDFLAIITFTDKIIYTVNKRGEIISNVISFDDLETDGILLPFILENGYVAEIYDVVSYVLHSVPDKITVKQLHLLLYYLQGWFLALHSRRLFSGNMQAWIVGPIHSKLFYGQGLSIHSLAECNYGCNLSYDLREYVKDVVKKYFKASTYFGSSLIMGEPYFKAREGYAVYERCEVEIDEKEMEGYFKKNLIQDI